MRMQLCQSHIAEILRMKVVTNPEQELVIPRTISILLPEFIVYVKLNEYGMSIGYVDRCTIRLRPI